MKTNKQLKDNYRQMKFKIGVFQVRNTANGKIFIGSSPNLDAIWNRMRMELKFGGHRNEILQNEWKEFGEDFFKFEILSEIEQKNSEQQSDHNREVKELEAMFIDELQPFGE